MKKPFGFIAIDKPIGLTSHDCVNRLRKVYGIKKIGHGGTLDPSVTGVLPIAIGDATRLISYLKGSKVYKGAIQLGKSTNTDDLEGDLINTKQWPSMDINFLENLFDQFRGEIEQKPPAFSSIHIKGERAYKRARKGENFELPNKKVIINELKLINWSPLTGEIVIEINCSAGTYIRSLARDIGIKIGCGGCLKSLRRIKSNGFTENHSVMLPKKSDKYSEKEIPEILNPMNFLNHLPTFKLKSQEENISWRSGRRINFSTRKEDLLRLKRNKIELKDNNTNFLVFDEKDNIAGIAETIDGSILKPKIVFNAIG